VHTKETILLRELPEDALNEVLSALVPFLADKFLAQHNA
jgi:hypothetical protein